MNVRLRRAEPADSAAIGALIKALAEYEQLAHEVRWTLEQLHDALFGSDAVPQVLLAELDRDERDDNEAGEADRDRKIVGMALWFRTFSTFRGESGIWLEDLFVDPAYRGRGIGRALLHELRGQTRGRVEWSVLNWNEPAHGFYRSLGAFPMSEWTTWRWADDEAAPA